jgi:transposase-like protein
MQSKRARPEEIIKKVREGEALLSQGKSTEDLCRQLQITVATWYRWHHKYGGMKTPEMQRLKELERENARLKKLVANMALDHEILKEALKGKY